MNLVIWNFVVRVIHSHVYQGQVVPTRKKYAEILTLHIYKTYPIIIYYAFNILIISLDLI